MQCFGRPHSPNCTPLFLLQITHTSPTHSVSGEVPLDLPTCGVPTTLCLLGNSYNTKEIIMNDSGFRRWTENTDISRFPWSHHCFVKMSTKGSKSIESHIIYLSWLKCYRIVAKNCRGNNVGMEDKSFWQGTTLAFFNQYGMVQMFEPTVSIGLNQHSK